MLLAVAVAHGRTRRARVLAPSTGKLRLGAGEGGAGARLNSACSQYTNLPPQFLNLRLSSVLHLGEQIPFLKKMTNNSEKDSISTNKDNQSDDDNEETSSSSSSEIDEVDCERRKASINAYLTDLERQFVNLREQLYLARRERVISKLDEVKAGKAPEYLQPLEDLQDQMRIRTEVAGILKELRLKNIRCQYDAEQLAVKQNFDSERRAIIDNIRFDIEEKLRHLDEDKNALEYNETPVEHFGLTRDHLFLPDRRRKPVSIAGPYIIYMLREHEIMEDHAQIRKAIQISLARDCA